MFQTTNQITFLYTTLVLHHHHHRREDGRSWPHPQGQATCWSHYRRPSHPPWPPKGAHSAFCRCQAPHRQSLCGKTLRWSDRQHRRLIPQGEWQALSRQQEAWCPKQPLPHLADLAQPAPHRDGKTGQRAKRTQGVSWLVVWTPLKNISQLGWLYSRWLGNSK